MRRASVRREHLKVFRNVQVGVLDRLARIDPDLKRVLPEGVLFEGGVFVVMRQSRRPDRVADLLQREISEIFCRVVKDPRVQGVTVTSVRVSRDLKLARVYYSTIGDKDRQKEVAQGLKSVKGIVKRELGRNLNLRYTPDLDFLFDDSLEYAEHINSLLKEIQPEDS